MRVNVLPYQRGHPSLPVRLCEHPLGHQRVDIDHAVLDQVQSEHTWGDRRRGAAHETEKIVRRRP
jgi:hypothetical protein